MGCTVAKNLLTSIAHYFCNCLQSTIAKEIASRSPAPQFWVYLIHKMKHKLCLSVFLSFKKKKHKFHFDSYLTVCNTISLNLHIMFTICIQGTTGNRLYVECQVVCRMFFFGHSAKKLLYQVSKKNTAECFFLTLGKFFWHLAKKFFAECYFFTLGKHKFQSTFWSSKLIQMKKVYNTNLYNFLRSTNFILVISSFDKLIVTLFTKSISLS
jgi:hypothetical protein